MNVTINGYINISIVAQQGGTTDLGDTPARITIAATGTTTELLDGSYGLHDWILDKFPELDEDAQFDEINSVEGRIINHIAEGNLSGQVISNGVAYAYAVVNATYTAA